MRLKLTLSLLLTASLSPAAVTLVVTNLHFTNAAFCGVVGEIAGISSSGTPYFYNGSTLVTLPNPTGLSGSAQDLTRTGTSA